MQSELARRSVDAAFSRLGVGGTYGGSACRVLFPKDADEGIDFGGMARPVGRVSLISVRASEVTPAEGGVFVVDGTSYKVAAKPLKKDAARLVWTCKVTTG